MINNILKKSGCLFVCFILMSNMLFAQTGGSSDLSSIEYKSGMILKNDDKVGELNRQHLETYNLESIKIAKLKKEINDLIAEKESVIDEYRRGQFCTGCQVPRSEFKPGESFPHAGQRVRAATPEEIYKKEKYYDDKINPKKAQLAELESDENEFTRKRKDIDEQMSKLKDNSDKLREEIVALSKSYNDKVKAYAKSLQTVWIEDLMRQVAEKHTIEDKIAIYEVKLKDLNAEEVKTIAESKEKTRKQNEADIKKIDQQIFLENNKITTLRQKFEVNASAIKSTVTSYEQRLNEVEALLTNISKLAEPDIIAYRAEAADLKQKIIESKADLKKTIDIFEIDKSDIEKNIKMFQNKSWELTINLSKRQDAAVVLIKQVYVTKQKLINDAIASRKESLQKCGDLLISKKRNYINKFSDLVDIVKQEQDRLVIACRNSGASCFGTYVQGDVVLQWNNSLGCVSAMENSRAMNGTFFGCEEESVVYKSHYNASLGAMSSSDTEALQRKVSKTRYDLILQKITD